MRLKATTQEVTAWSARSYIHIGSQTTRTTGLGVSQADQTILPVPALLIVGKKGAKLTFSHSAQHSQLLVLAHKSSHT